MKAIVNPTHFLSAWTCIQYLFSDKENYVECLVDTEAGLFRIYDLKHTLDICMPLMDGSEEGSRHYLLHTLPKISIKAKNLETDTKIVFEPNKISIDSFEVNIQPSTNTVDFLYGHALPKTREAKPYFSTAYYLKNIASLSSKFPDKTDWYFDPSDKYIYSTSKNRVTRVKSSFFPASSINTSALKSSIVVQLFKKLVNLFDAYDRCEEDNSLVFGEQSENFYIEYFFNTRESNFPDSVEYSKAVLSSNATPNLILTLNDGTAKQVFDDLKIVKDQIDRKNDTVQILIEEEKLCFKAYSEMSEASTFMSVSPTKIEGSLKNPLYLLNKELLASLDMFKSSKEVLIKVWEDYHLIEIKSGFNSNFLLRLLVA